MGSIEDAVERFGKSLEIEGLRFNRYNVVRLDIEKMGRLYLERLEQGIVLYIAAQIEGGTGAALASALEMCHYRLVRPISISAGFQSPNWLIFAVRLNRPEVTPDGIETALDELFPCVEHIQSQ